MNKKYFIYIILIIVGVAFLFFVGGFFRLNTPDNTALCSYWQSDRAQQENSNWQLCLDFLERIDTDGIAESFNLFLDTYESNSDFRAGGCHLLAHVIGRKAYHEDYHDFTNPPVFIDIPLKERTCAVKTYHGFFREYFLDKGIDDQTVRTAVGICDRTKEAFDRPTVNGVIDHCYAGIGYGLAVGHAFSIGPDSTAISDASIGHCEEYIDTGEDIYQCYHGVFESLRTMYAGFISLPDVRFDITQDSVLSVCEDQPTTAKQISCLIAFRPYVYELYDQNLKDVISLLNKFNSRVVEHAARSYTGGAFAHFLEQGMTAEEMARECSSLASGFHDPCVSEFTYRMVLTNNIEMANDFCSALVLSASSRDVCFESFVESINDLYPDDTILDMCMDITDDFWRMTCESESNST